MPVRVDTVSTPVAELVHQPDQRPPVPLFKRSITPTRTAADIQAHNNMREDTTGLVNKVNATGARIPSANRETLTGACR